MSLLTFTILASRDIPSYTSDGFLLSFLVAGENELATALRRISKARRFQIETVSYHLDTGSIINSKYDAEAAAILSIYNNLVSDINPNNGYTVLYKVVILSVPRSPNKPELLLSVQGEGELPDHFGLVLLHPAFPAKEKFKSKDFKWMSLSYLHYLAQQPSRPVCNTSLSSPTHHPSMRKTS